MSMPRAAALALAAMAAIAAAPAASAGTLPMMTAQASGGPMTITPAPPPQDRYQPAPGPYAAPQQGQQDAPPPGRYQAPAQNGYAPPSGQHYDGPPGGRPDDRYAAPPGPDYVPPEEKGTFSIEEITEAGHRFFGRVSMGLARVIEHAFARAGRPNGYILGEEAGGAFVAGLRYGEGMLYTKDAGEHKVYWQGPSIGYDFGAEGSKTMVLVYNLRDVSDLYRTFAGIDGSAYFIGGVGITFMSRDKVTLAPIRSGVGLRLGANIGYLKYTRRPTWNPF